jgi:hypothetical protein
MHSPGLPCSVFPGGEEKEDVSGRSWCHCAALLPPKQFRNELFLTPSIMPDCQRVTGAATDRLPGGTRFSVERPLPSGILNLIYVGLY